MLVIFSYIFYATSLVRNVAASFKGIGDQDTVIALSMDPNNAGYVNAGYLSAPLDADKLVWAGKSAPFAWLGG